MLCCGQHVDQRGIADSLGCLMKAIEVKTALAVVVAVLITAGLYLYYMVPYHRCVEETTMTIGGDDKAAEAACLKLLTQK